MSFGITMSARPEPKFKQGNLVQYCPAEKKRLFDYMAIRKGSGEMPTGRLIIWCDPAWDDTGKQWVYQYEYGWDGTHEGSAVESSLVAFP